MDLSTLYLIFGDANQDRRAKAIKNILDGRRTVSNLYWGLEYGLLPYFGALHDFDLGDEQAAVNTLNKAGLATVSDGLLYRLSNRGVDQQNELQASVTPLDELATVAQYDIVRFSRRFIFAVQVVSEYSYSNNRYYPQTIGFFDDQLIKRWFIQNKQRNLSNYFHQLLQQFLSGLENDQLADIFAASLTGHGFSGLTEDQLAIQTDLEPTIIQLNWLKLYSRLFLRLKKDPETPLQLLLTGLIKPLMSGSAKQTFDLFVSARQPDPATIAQLRKIKLTTVYEHLIEAAIELPLDQFPYQRLLHEPTLTNLRQAAPVNVGEWQFKAAKAQITDLQFFEFRLFQISERKKGDND